MTREEFLDLNPEYIELEKLGIIDIDMILSITDDEIAEKRVLEEQVLSNENNKAYLKETDWYVSRLAETGKAIPEDILQKRQEARDSKVENN